MDRPLKRGRQSGGRPLSRATASPRSVSSITNADRAQLPQRAIEHGRSVGDPDDVALPSHLPSTLPGERAASQTQHGPESDRGRLGDRYLRTRAASPEDRPRDFRSRGRDDRSLGIGGNRDRRHWQRALIPDQAVPFERRADERVIPIEPGWIQVPPPSQVIEGTRLRQQARNIRHKQDVEELRTGNTGQSLFQGSGKKGLLPLEGLRIQDRGTPKLHGLSPSSKRVCPQRSRVRREKRLLSCGLSRDDLGSIRDRTGLGKRRGQGQGQRGEDRQPTEARRPFQPPKISASRIHDEPTSLAPVQYECRSSTMPDILHGTMGISEVGPPGLK